MTKIARMPVSTTVTLEEYAYVKNNRLEFSKLLSAAIRVQMKKKVELEEELDPAEVRAALDSIVSDLPPEAPQSAEERVRFVKWHEVWSRSFMSPMGTQIRVRPPLKEAWAIWRDEERIAAENAPPAGAT